MEIKFNTHQHDLKAVFVDDRSDYRDARDPFTVEVPFTYDQSAILDGLTKIWNDSTVEVRDFVLGANQTLTEEESITDKSSEYTEENRQVYTETELRYKEDGLYEISHNIIPTKEWVLERIEKNDVEGGLEEFYKRGVYYFDKETEQIHIYTKDCERLTSVTKTKTGYSTNISDIVTPVDSVEEIGDSVYVVKDGERQNFTEFVNEELGIWLPTLDDMIAQGIITVDSIPYETTKLDLVDAPCIDPACLILMDLSGTNVERKCEYIFSTWHLQDCWFAISLKILEQAKCTNCPNPTQLKENRDLLWMLLNVIQYLIDQDMWFKAECYIEWISTCGAICKDQKYENKGDCGCH